MEQTLEKPILGLGDEFPERLWILKHPPTSKYACFAYRGIHGLAVFSTQNGAFRFSEHIDLTGMTSSEVSFDEARDIAKGRPHPVVSMMLLDDLENPQIHYIR